jgi:type VI secretion system protein ImpA
MQEFPEGFDLAALLAPISEEAPAGTDLREDPSSSSLYRRLRDARTEARDAERAQDAPPTEDDQRPLGSGSAIPPAARWQTVRELAIEALITHCKDLEIAAWLAEALLRSDGLIGLAAGFRLMEGLVETFWDVIYPLPDEEGIVTRVAPITGLNGLDRDGTLVQPLRKLVLFERPTDGSPFSLSQYEQSAGLLGPEQRAAALPFEVVENEARTAGGDHFTLLRNQAAEAAEAWRALGEGLDRRLVKKEEKDALANTRIRVLLEHILEASDRFGAPGAQVSSETATPEPGEDEGIVAAAPGRGTARPAAGGLTTREDALRALAQIAEFFRRTEPLSPIAYTLQEAVRRSRMTWPELLAEIVPDATSRSAILTSLGIRPPPSE